MSRGNEGNDWSEREKGCVKVGIGGSLVFGLKLGRMLDSRGTNLESAKCKKMFEIKWWFKTGIEGVCGKDLWVSECQ